MTGTRRKTVIALTMRICEAPDYRETRDAISHDWVNRLDAWNMIPILVPNALTDPAAYLEGVRPDVLVLTGGDDLGATPERDDAEAVMLDHARERALPVLGVCRGMQLINTRLGGGLVHVDGHAGGRHGVSVAAPWTEIYGASVEVNSYHTEGMARDGLAPDLIVTATDDRDRVEACCHREEPLAAVMWHPERDAGLDGDRLLIAGLAGRGAFWN